MTVPEISPRGLPLYLDVAGRLVVVVGGGPVALRKTLACLDAGAAVTVIALVPCPELLALAGSGRITLRVRAFVVADLDGCWLVFTACGTAADADVAAAAEARRVFCVRSDSGRGRGGSHSPAVVRHDGVTVAVSAGGDPRRAQALRDQIAVFLATGVQKAPGRERSTGQPVTPALGDVRHLELVPAGQSRVGGE